ncbi:hypothetical protein Bpfe_016132 [Biomphalaria pfeifferi]|uniref:Uncharacterized protein n=1 Tax=Biomphalaria pfeifferi TaxID=112525 RepID=A0AAD8F8U8_BIOPF|nr:hypothetical protein Bpfe_016132 [Biomphalaria pfeifferi]
MKAKTTNKQHERGQEIKGDKTKQRNAFSEAMDTPVQPASSCYLLTWKANPPSVSPSHQTGEACRLLGSKSRGALLCFPLSLRVKLLTLRRPVSGISPPYSLPSLGVRRKEHKTGAVSIFMSRRAVTGTEEYEHRTLC